MFKFRKLFALLIDMIPILLKLFTTLEVLFNIRQSWFLLADVQSKFLCTFLEEVPTRSIAKGFMKDSRPTKSATRLNGNYKKTRVIH